MKRRCEACPSTPVRDPGPGPFCQWCGSSAIVTPDEGADGEPKRGSSVEVVSADEVEEMAPLIETKAPIFACIGGYGLGSVVSVSAPPGGGKTTEALRVAVAQNARVLHLIYGECSPEQARAAAKDAGASAKWFREKKHQIATAESWQEAAEYMDRVCSSRKRPEFVIWDSTSMWVPAIETEEREFIAENVRMADEYKIVVFCITHWSQQGRGKGTLTIPHGGALWMRIKPTTFEVLKARPPWSGKQGVYQRPFLKPGQTWPGKR